MTDEQFERLMDRLETINDRLHAVESAVLGVELSVSTSDVYGIDDVVAGLRAVEEAVRDNG